MLVITGTAISKNTPLPCLNCCFPLNCQICDAGKEKEEEKSFSNIT